MVITAHSSCGWQSARHLMAANKQNLTKLPANKQTLTKLPNALLCTWHLILFRPRPESPRYATPTVTRRSALIICCIGSTPARTKFFTKNLSHPIRWVESQVSLPLTLKRWTWRSTRPSRIQKKGCKKIPQKKILDTHTRKFLCPGMLLYAKVKSILSYNTISIPKEFIRNNVQQGKCLTQSLQIWIWPSTEITLFERTRQIAWLDAVTAQFDKKRVNSCVRIHLLLEEVEQQNISPNKPDLKTKAQTLASKAQTLTKQYSHRLMHTLVSLTTQDPVCVCVACVRDYVNIQRKMSNSRCWFYVDAHNYARSELL